MAVEEEGEKKLCELLEREGYKEFVTPIGVLEEATSSSSKNSEIVVVVE